MDIYKCKLEQWPQTTELQLRDLYSQVLNLLVGIYSENFTAPKNRTQSPKHQISNF